jgi:large conductance mechanosensitive channel
MMMKQIEKKVGGFFTEFWKFAAKGNVFDLAIAVVVGNAFTAVVNGLVADFFLPMLSVLTSNINLSTLAYTLPMKAGEPVVIKYGHFLGVTLNFLIVAFSVYIMFIFITRLRARLTKAEEKEPTPPPISTEEKLLSEIRDLLKEQNVGKNA